MKASLRVQVDTYERIRRVVHSGFVMVKFEGSGDAWAVRYPSEVWTGAEPPQTGTPTDTPDVDCAPMAVEPSTPASENETKKKQPSRTCKQKATTSTGPSRTSAAVKGFDAATKHACLLGGALSLSGEGAVDRLVRVFWSEYR